MNIQRTNKRNFFLENKQENLKLGLAWIQFIEYKIYFLLKLIFHGLKDWVKVVRHIFKNIIHMAGLARLGLKIDALCRFRVDYMI